MTSRRNSRIAGVMLMAACIAALGCKKEEPPPPQPPSKPLQTAALPVQKQPSSVRVAASQAMQKQFSSLRHVPSTGTTIEFASRKDPFKPFVSEPVTPVKPLGAGRGGALLPIQSYDVNKFRLTGIVSGLKENRALIVDPLGKGYVVKTGMLLGSNNGRITKITNSALEVVEQFRDDNGIVRKHTVRLALPQKK